MTPKQVEIIETTFAAAVPRADELAEVFYDILFAENPGVRDMFPGDLTEQRKKLVASLAGIVQALRHPDDFQARVTNLGKRHLFYGAEDGHYDAVGAALLAALAKLFGGQFTTEVRDAWATAYGAIADLMRTAASQAKPHLELAS